MIYKPLKCLESRKRARISGKPNEKTFDHLLLQSVPLLSFDPPPPESVMRLDEDNSLLSFMDEESKKIKLPRRLSFGNQEDDSHLYSARTSCASANPRSPDTPWTRSPPRTSTTPSLLYHCLASLHRQEGNILSIAVSKDYIYTGSESSRIHAWKLPDCIETGCIKAKAGEVRAIFAHGSFLYTTHGDCKIRVWDISLTERFRAKKIATLSRKRSFFSYPRKNVHQHNNNISCIAYNHTENLLYTGLWDRTVKAWKVSERRCVDSFVAHEANLNAIAINQQDGCVITCSSDGTIKIWRRVSRESSHTLTMTLKFQPSPVNALALSMSTKGCFLYSGSSDGLINFWEKEKMSGRFNHGGFLQGHHFAVLCLESIMDLILSGSEDATIRIWRREEGNSFHSCLTVMDGHHGPVRCLAATLEMEDTVIGLLVYSASFDQTFKVWRVKVYPAENTNQINLLVNSRQSEIAEFEMNPVLSPSWVEKKIQSSPFQF